MLIAKQAQPIPEFSDRVYTVLKNSYTLFHKDKEVTNGWTFDASCPSGSVWFSRKINGREVRVFATPYWDGQGGISVDVWVDEIQVEEWLTVLPAPFYPGQTANQIINNYLAIMVPYLLCVKICVEHGTFAEEDVVL